MCVLGSFSARAQYSGEVTSSVKSDYSQDVITFKMTDVAQTLGTDTATLRAALNSWASTAPATDADKMFVLYDKDGDPVTGYTGNYGEFWLDEAGQAHAYSGAAWYIGCSWNNGDSVNIYVGQMPNHFTASDTLTAKVGILYGGKAATFDITYHIYMPELPTQELQVSKLNIVGETSTSIEQYPRSGYNTDPVYVSLAGLPEKFGISKTDFNALISKIVYMPKLDATYGTMSDSLTLASTNDGWLKYALSSTGDTLKTCGTTAYDKADQMFINGFSYNLDNDTLTANLGQYPSNLKAGDNLNADVYIVYGDKAYKINYGLSIIEAPYHGLDDMTQVGDTTITISEEPDNNYTAVNFTVNAAAIAAALGTTTSNLSFQALDENKSLSSNTTANNGGYWMTKTGTITSWGSSAAFFVEPVTANDFTTFHIGQYPSSLVAGDTCRTTLYFINGDKYYSLNIVLAIIKGQTSDQSTWTVVTTKPAVIQQVKDDAYSFSDVNGTTYTLPIAQTNTLIGTTTPTFYALEQDTAVAAGAEKYTKVYTCTPNPGFWLSENGEKESWGTNAKWGIVYDTSTGVIRCIQYPSRSEVGTTYTGKFYLVNEETGKMIQINLTYQIVDKIDTSKVVGTMDMMLPLSADDQTATVDLSKVATALGFANVSELLSNYTLCGVQENGLYSEAQDPVNNGVHLNKNGYADQDGVYGITFQANSDGTVSALTYSNDGDLEGTYEIHATIAFKNGNKVYAISLTLVDPDTYTGIENVKTDIQKNGKIYDLSGRQVSKAVKGVYIMNGKKYVVK
jgi:hypothetical protein